MIRLERLLPALLATGLMACGPSGDTSSELHDIFVEDREGATADGNARRHKAKADELMWTISMGGCTGSLLNKDYMLTANHCSPRAGARYRSGSALAKAGSPDITVASVAESSSTLDYSILKITWASGTPPADQLWPGLIATSQADVKMGAAATEGDEVFTVGFPGDKSSTWGATYAEGRLKAVRGNNLSYNIGIINGNSGGAVWRRSDKMLVSMTNAGPNALNQGSWNTGSADDSRHWNYGAAMWRVYTQSELMKTIFPNGKNATPHPSVTPTPESPVPAPTGANALFLALERLGTDDESVVFYLSAPAQAAAAAMCVGAETCLASTPGARLGARLATVGTRAIFSFQAPTSVSHGLKISFSAADQAGVAFGSGRTVTLTKKTTSLQASH